MQAASTAPARGRASESFLASRAAERFLHSRLLVTSASAHLEPDPARTLLAIVNPVAGSCDPDTLCAALEAACQEAGLSLEVRRTTPDADPAAMARDWAARGGRRLAVAGGDGTISAVASGLPRTGVELALLPAGTANKLAHELRIPQELEAACRLAATGSRLRRLDGLRVGDRVFLCHVSVGVYSEIATTASVDAKRTFRQLAYVWNAIPRLLQRRSWRFHLELDGVPLRTRAAFVLAANVGGLGAGRLRFGEDIVPDDRVLDVCIVRARSLRDYARLAWHMVRRRQREAPGISFRKVRRSLRVRVRRRAPMSGDGEILDGRALDLELLPAAIPVVVPDEPQVRS